MNLLDDLVVDQSFKYFGCVGYKSYFVADFGSPALKTGTTLWIFHLYIQKTTE